MKLLRLFCISASLTTLNGQAVNKPVRTDFTCVESMAIPHGTQHEATARVLFTVGDDGRQVNLSVQVRYQADQAFAAWLRAQLFDARFSTRCAGEIIEVNFIYLLQGKPSTSPESEIRLKNANTFEVITTPFAGKPIVDGPPPLR